MGGGAPKSFAAGATSAGATSFDLSVGHLLDFAAESIDRLV